MRHIRLTNPERTGTGAVCIRDDGPDTIVHLESECHLAHGLRHQADRCSVCDLPWGEGAYSQHERCALLFDDGIRQYAYCQRLAQTPDGEVIEISYK